MKNVKFRGIPRQKDEFRGKNLWKKLKFRGSAVRENLWALLMSDGMTTVSILGRCLFYHILIKLSFSIKHSINYVHGFI